MEYKKGTAHILNPKQQLFAKDMVKAAIASGHVFPNYAAAEACIETNFGEFGGTNLFGVEDGKFETYEDSFRARMDGFSGDSRFEAAVNAPNGDQYITVASDGDELRRESVLNVLNEHRVLFETNTEEEYDPGQQKSNAILRGKETPE